MQLHRTSPKLVLFLKRCFPPVLVVNQFLHVLINRTHPSCDVIFSQECPKQARTAHFTESNWLSLIQSETDRNWLKQTEADWNWLKIDRNRLKSGVKHQNCTKISFWDFAFKVGAKQHLRVTFPPVAPPDSPLLLSHTLVQRRKCKTWMPLSGEWLG